MKRQYVTHGEAAFAAMLEEDEGASMLGEVALVGIDDSQIDPALCCKSSKVDRGCMISDEKTSVIAATGSDDRVSVIEKGAWAGRYVR